MIALRAARDPLGPRRAADLDATCADKKSGESLKLAASSDTVHWGYVWVRGTGGDEAAAGCPSSPGAVLLAALAAAAC